MARQWWESLPAAQRREYERSEAISRVPLRANPAFASALAALDSALREDDRAATEDAARALVRMLCDALRVPRVAVRVLGMRPHDRSGELHGLYTSTGVRGREEIKVWMRTAKRRDVVKTKTFLRTLLHEVCHHLDFFLFDLPHSFHSRGFYQRESSLLRVVARGTDLAPGGVAPAPREDARPADGQLDLASAAHLAARRSPGGGGGGDAPGLALLRAAAAAIAARQNPDQDEER